MDATVTVIVPFYNDELYLKRLIKCLLVQTYVDFCVLFINNNSRDGSEKIVSEAVSNYDRFKLFHQAIPGVSATRNFGLDIFSGEYVTFIDADDYVAPNHIQNLVEGFSNCSVDMTVTGFNYVENDRCIFSSEMLSGIVQASDAIERVFGLIGIQGFVANKMFKGSLLKSMHAYFDTSLIRYEDQEFTLRYLTKAKSINVVPGNTYYYVKHPDSALQTLSRGNMDMDLSSVDLMRQDLTHTQMANSKNMFYLDAMRYDIASSYFRKGDRLQRLNAEKIIKESWSWKMAFKNTSLKAGINALVVRTMVVISDIIRLGSLGN